MTRPNRQTAQQRLYILLGLLLAANLLLWGNKFVVALPAGALYSSGTAIGKDGAPLQYFDMLEFKREHFNYGLIIPLDGESSVIQTTGIAYHGLRGQFIVKLKGANSFGPSLLGKMLLNNNLIFDYSYLMVDGAKLSLLPMKEKFEGQCYYLLYRKRPYCGSAVQN
ncbi:hypothetical protein D3C84_763150 [compost metagenome]|jgi:hypothetical protein